MRLHKIFSVFLIFVMIFALTACGKNDTTDATNFQQYHGEGQTQGGIKSDEEISALQEEERNGTAETTTEDGNNDQPSSEGTPATSASGNPDDYWQGSNYFDLAGYLRANGADSVYGTDGQSIHETDSEIHSYVATFYNEKWHILINESSVTLAHVFYDQDNGGRLTFNPSYTPLYSLDEVGDYITVDNSGLQVRRIVLEQLFIIVDCIKADSSSDDPLSSSGLQYSNSPW